SLLRHSDVTSGISRCLLNTFNSYFNGIEGIFYLHHYLRRTLGNVKISVRLLSVIKTAEPKLNLFVSTVSYYLQLIILILPIFINLVFIFEGLFNLLLSITEINQAKFKKQSPGMAKAVTAVIKVSVKQHAF
ncbi:hypothetical protein C5L32_000001, partial [Lentilactobacillus buchneri]